MRTPEEIKKGLECCGNSDECKECPYRCIIDWCMGALAEDALAYIRQLEAQQPRWISVGERLPEDGQKIIAAFRDGGGLIIDQARYSNGEFDFASWAYVWGDNVTHWMPLPPGPEEEKNHE